MSIGWYSAGFVFGLLCTTAYWLRHWIKEESTFNLGHAVGACFSGMGVVASVRLIVLTVTTLKSMEAGGKPCGDCFSSEDLMILGVGALVMLIVSLTGIGISMK